MTDLKQHQFGRLIVIGVMILFSWLVVRASLSAAPLAIGQPDSIKKQSAANLIHNSFIYRFDPNTQTFVTITLPANSLPTDLVITGANPVHAWFTDFGRHSLGHLIFTDTLHYALAEFPITSTVNSGPYRLTLSGQHVWFTERGANRVGRLNTATGEIDEFFDHGLSAGGNLADIQVAPNGWVWIATPGTKRLVRLTVTSPQVYAFHEYTDTYRSNTFVIVPQYLAIEDNDTIWMTMPDRVTFQLGRLRPSVESFDYVTAPGGTLQQLIVKAGDIWLADSANNTLDQALIGTLPYIIPKVSITSPVGLAPATGNTFWVTQRTTPPAISRVIYTSTTNTSSTNTYLLPWTSSTLSEIAVGDDDSVWIAAYDPYRSYLPLIAAP